MRRPVMAGVELRLTQKADHLGDGCSFGCSFSGVVLRLQRGQKSNFGPIGGCLIRKNISKNRGFRLESSGLEGGCAIQLSYGRVCDVHFKRILNLSEAAEQSRLRWLGQLRFLLRSGGRICENAMLRHSTKVDYAQNSTYFLVREGIQVPDCDCLSQDGSGDPSYEW